MTTSESKKKEEEVPEAESLAKFLETAPPGELRRLPNATFRTPAALRQQQVVVPSQYFFKFPSIQLHCMNVQCGGPRNADGDTQDVVLHAGNRENFFKSYRCRNCNTLLKFYAVAITAPTIITEGTAVKIGEFPVFGPHLPPGVIDLLGTDADYFLKGHRAESQGLGIAAFAYYRRVVESQRTHIFDEIISAAEHIGADSTMIGRLKHLRQHWRFQQSIDELKGSLPQILLIEGQNPLELLHPVLSDSIHDRSDEEALEIAAEIRLVLINLTERIALAKTQSDELKRAVDKLSARKAARSKLNTTSGTGKKL